MAWAFLSSPAASPTGKGQVQGSHGYLVTINIFKGGMGKDTGQLGKTASQLQGPAMSGFRIEEKGQLFKEWIKHSNSREKNRRVGGA